MRLPNNARRFSFEKDACKVNESIESVWLRKHPKRHAVVVLFDEAGSVSIYDSHSPDEYYDKDPEVEMHRLMFASLVTVTDPGFGKSLVNYFNDLFFDAPLRNVVAAYKLPQLSKKQAEAYRTARAIINNRCELTKVATIKDDPDHGKDNV